MGFQSLNLFPHLAALQNVTLGPVTVKGVPRAAAEERGRALLARVGLGEKPDASPRRSPAGSSRGSRSRRPLAIGPKVLLFDEPTSALDRR